MFFKQIILDGSGALSYFIGCPKARKACVVNPKKDIEEYMDTAAQFGMQITDIIETAGFEARKSGAVELAGGTGAAVWFLEAKEKTGGKVAKTGALFRFGDAEVKIVRESRYTPFNKSLLVIDRAKPDKPWLVLTRRSLCADSRLNEAFAGKNMADELVDTTSFMNHTGLSFVFRCAIITLVRLLATGGTFYIFNTIKMVNLSKTMKIAVLHYHLKPGGVTTVISRQVAALKNDLDFLVISGQVPEGSMAVKTEVVPDIGYDSPDAPACTDPAAGADRILAAIRRHWPGGCDLIHIHNPLLAKNHHFLKILSTLEARGAKLLLHVHDFAEDGRPGAWFADDPYPKKSHFCVINSRDKSILIQAGADAAGVHLTPNMVTPLPAAPASAFVENTALYPVRALRRKNIGEALLLSLFFPGREAVAITLAPNSPSDIAPYNRWKTFVHDNGLNARFEASAGRDFAALVAASAFIITTSITEGFGFSFLEPWTAGKTLWGRKLPDICADFEGAGLDLGHLYEAVNIPVDWIGKAVLAEKIKQAVEKSCQAFGLDPGPRANRFTALADASFIDFGRLDEAMQQQVLARLMVSKQAHEAVDALNPWLNSMGTRLDESHIEQNRNAVQAGFNSAVCAGRLLSAYRAATGGEVVHNIDKTALLDRFFCPETFSLLKWGAP